MDVSMGGGGQKLRPKKELLFRGRRSPARRPPAQVGTEAKNTLHAFLAIPGAGWKTCQSNPYGFWVD